MSGGISMGSLLAAAAVGIVASRALAPKAPQAPQMPAAPAAPPQQSKMPEQQAARAGGGGAASYGNAMAGPLATMASGLNGVAPGTLNLGKNTLLGA